MKGKSKFLLLFLVADVAVTSAATLLYSSPHASDGKGEGYLFTFAQTTDSQFSGSSAIFEKATTWLAREGNVSFVIHTGDIVNGIRDEAAWKNAYRYMHQLDNRSRWAVLAGDNDVVFRGVADLTKYTKYFGEDSIDQYVIVKKRLLFILLSWRNVDGSISKARLEWMDDIIQQYRNLDVIICLHPYLFGSPFPNILSTPNADEIWDHTGKHENVVMTLSGHLHQNWVRIRANGKCKVWSIMTEALAEKGYIRLFDVYEDKIEVYAYSPWTGKTYTGPLDRFTVELGPRSFDVDRDLWGDEFDIMPTHPLVPNSILISAAAAGAILTYWVKDRRTGRRQTLFPGKS